MVARERGSHQTVTVLGSAQVVHAKFRGLMTGSILQSASRRRVGRYLICGEMASGGMASVHLGRLLGPVGFSKIVAIKRLHSQFATDPEFLAMFIDEARLASAISHPNVVSSLDVVVENDELLLVMEYVQGETLAQLAKLARQHKAPPPLRVLLRILCDTLDGLHAAHTASVGGRALNIVHRDVSPQNIMVGVNGVARVLDFGIAKAASQSQTTRPGRVKGKFAYLSPEQLRGLPVDPRTDVFSAGVVLWEGLTGSRLFLADRLEETAKRVLSGPIVAPSRKNPDVSPDLDRIVLRALSRAREERFESALEFADALRALPGEATRAEVSAWVSKTASDVLAQRLEAVHELEAMDVAHAGIVASSAPPPAIGSKLAEATTKRAPTEDATLSSSAPHTSGGTTRSLSPKSARQRRALWGLGVTLLVLLIGALGFAAGRPGAIAVSSTESGLKPRTAAADAASASPVSSTPTSAVPVLQVDQLATAPQPTQLGSDEAPVATTAKPAAPVKAVRNRKPALSVNCKIPYRIDASGVRRVRMECL